MSVYAIFANTNTNVAVSQTKTKKIERHKKEQLNRKNILQLLFLQLYYFFDSVLCNLKVVFVKLNAYEVPVCINTGDTG